MANLFRCPTCKAVLSLADDCAGLKTSCPKCGQRMTVPAPPTPTPGLAAAVNKTVPSECVPPADPKPTPATPAEAIGRKTIGCMTFTVLLLAACCWGRIFPPTSHDRQSAPESDPVQVAGGAGGVWTESPSPAAKTPAEPPATNPREPKETAATGSLPPDSTKGNAPDMNRVEHVGKQPNQPVTRALKRLKAAEVPCFPNGWKVGEWGRFTSPIGVPVNFKINKIVSDKEAIIRADSNPSVRIIARGDDFSKLADGSYYFTHDAWEFTKVERTSSRTYLVAELIGIVDYRDNLRK